MTRLRELSETIRWTIVGLIAPDLLAYVMELQDELKAERGI